MLPSEYQQVEYLESSGTQYISTGVAITSNYERLQIKIMVLRVTPGDRYFGIWGGKGCSIDGYPGYGPLDNIYVGGTTFGGASTSLNTEYIIDLTADNGTLTGEYCGNAINRSYSGTVGTTIIENVFKDQGQPKCYARIYYYRLSTADGLQRDFIPCYRKSDSKPGFYDVVSKTFFTNAGTGEFIVGPNV